MRAEMELLFMIIYEFCIRVRDGGPARAPTIKIDADAAIDLAEASAAGIRSAAHAIGAARLLDEAGADECIYDMSLVVCASGSLALDNDLCVYTCAAMAELLAYISYTETHCTEPRPGAVQIDAGPFLDAARAGSIEAAAILPALNSLYVLIGVTTYMHWNNLCLYRPYPGEPPHFNMAFPTEQCVCFTPEGRECVAAKREWEPATGTGRVYRAREQSARVCAFIAPKTFRVDVLRAYVPPIIVSYHGLAMLGVPPPPAHSLSIIIAGARGTVRGDDPVTMPALEAVQAWYDMYINGI
jgi:hypothetical protein